MRGFEAGLDHGLHEVGVEDIARPDHREGRRVVGVRRRGQARHERGNENEGSAGHDTAGGESEHGEVLARAPTYYLDTSGNAVVAPAADDARRTPRLRR